MESRRERDSNYDRLLKLGGPRNYEGEIMLMAFVGPPHVLLLATVFYTINAALTTTAKVRVTLRALSATPADAAGTLYALHRLLAPIEKIL